MPFIGITKIVRYCAHRRVKCEIGCLNPLAPSEMYHALNNFHWGTVKFRVSGQSRISPHRTKRRKKYSSFFALGFIISKGDISPTGMKWATDRLEKWLFWSESGQCLPSVMQTPGQECLPDILLFLLHFPAFPLLFAHTFKRRDTVWRTTPSSPYTVGRKRCASTVACV